MLLFLTLASYAIDFVGGWFGARRFGATRWGMVGAVVGAIIGLFFGLPGLLAGPVLGALTGEIIGGQTADCCRPGRLGGIVRQSCRYCFGKLLIALAMVSWFLVAAPAPF